jgi:hypothetical protein
VRQPHPDRDSEVGRHQRAAAGEPHRRARVGDVTSCRSNAGEENEARRRTDEFSPGRRRGSRPEKNQHEHEKDRPGLFFMSLDGVVEAPESWTVPTSTRSRRKRSAPRRGIGHPAAAPADLPAVRGLLAPPDQRRAVRGPGRTMRLSSLPPRPSRRSGERTRNCSWGTCSRGSAG